MNRTNIEWDKYLVGQTLSGSNNKWDRQHIRHWVAQTFDWTNIHFDKHWLDIYWLGQTLNGSNIKWVNNESNKHRVGQNSCRTNIMWDKHQVGQTLSGINIKLAKIQFEEIFSETKTE